MRNTQPDDLGDDEQETVAGEYERGIELDDMVLENEPDEGTISIDRWLEQEARPGDDQGPPVPEPAEEAAVHIEKPR